MKSTEAPKARKTPKELAWYDGRMKSRARPRTKAEHVPAPTKAQFEGFVRKIVSVPKAELDRRALAYQKKRDTKA